MVFQSGCGRCRTARVGTGCCPNSLDSSSSSPSPCGKGHPTPAAAARSRYSWTVLSPIRQLRAICRCPSPNSNLNLRTSLTFRMDDLLAGTLFSFLMEFQCRDIVQCCCTSCCSPVENIPLQAERHSGRRAKLFAFPPESVSAFRTECCSESKRNRVRLQNGIAFAFDRIPQESDHIHIAGDTVVSFDVVGIGRSRLELYVVNSEKAVELQVVIDELLQYVFLHADRELVGLQPINRSGGYDPAHFRGFLCDAICPSPVAAFRVHCRNPTFGSRSFHIFKRVVAFGLQDHVDLRFIFQSNDEVWHVVVHLAVVQVRDSESETCVFDERMHRVVLVDVIGSRLLPSLRVWHDIVDVASQDFHWLSASPVIDISRRAGAACGLVARNFRCFPF